MPPMRNRTNTHGDCSRQNTRLTRPDWPQNGLSSETIVTYIRRVQYTVLSVAGLKGIRRAPRTPIPLRREAGLQPTCSRPMRRSN